MRKGKRKLLKENKRGWDLKTWTKKGEKLEKKKEIQTK